MIARLKKQVEMLKAELAIARGDTQVGEDEELKSYEKEACQQAVDEFLKENTPITFADMRKLQYCYQLLKQRALATVIPNSPAVAPTLPAIVPSSSASSSSPDQSNALIRKLQQQAIQRDIEIGTLRFLSIRGQGLKNAN